MGASAGFTRRAGVDAPAFDMASATEDWQRLVSLCGDGEWALDAQGKVAYLSERLCERLGCDGPARMGMSLAQAFGLAEGDPSRADRAVHAVFQAREPLSNWALGPTGARAHERHWLLNGQPRFAQDGQFLGYLGVAKDVTQEVQLVAQLRADQATAQAASQAKSRMLAHMSHDIRTPLNGVLGVVDLLLKTPLAPRQRHFARTLRGSAESMLVLLNDILDLSKIEAGQVQLERLAFDPRQLSQQVCLLFAEAAQAKGLELVCLIEDDVPDGVLGDPHRIRQALNNLVGNAVKFTEHGDVCLHLRAGVAPAQGWPRLHWQVRDSGPGMATEVKARLFTAFAQGDSTTSRRYGGTGLGLTITRQLVELMGGAIQVHSQLGVGSMFEIALPLALADSTVKVPVPRPPESLNALLVEPHALAREATLRALRRLGLNCEAVAELSQAEALWRAAPDLRPHDLVVYSEPSATGRASPWAEQLRHALGAALPCLVKLVPMAALAQQDDPHATGAHLYCPKPATEMELRRALGNGSQHAPHEAGADTEWEATTLRQGLAAHVLLVEDDRINAEVATEMLQELGCTVVHVADGAQAVARFCEQGFDVVFMDCQMPVLDGYEATRRMRAFELARSADAAQGAWPRTPILALTANALDGERDRCLDAGMDDHIAKPFRRKQLRAALRRWAAAAPSGPLALPAAPGAAGVDRAALMESLRIGEHTSAELVVRVVDLFLNDTPALLEALAKGLASAQAQGIEQAVHSLKSASAMVGAFGLSELAAEAEFQARAGHLERLAEIAPQLQQLHAQVAAELKAIRDDIAQLSAQGQIP